MKKVKTSAVQWDGLDVHAWVEYQAELGEPKKNLLIKDLKKKIKILLILISKKHLNGGNK